MNQIDEGLWLILPILLSGIAGIYLLISSLFSHIGAAKHRDEKKLHVFVGTVLSLSVLLTFAAIWRGSGV